MFRSLTLVLYSAVKVQTKFTPQKGKIKLFPAQSDTNLSVYENRSSVEISVVTEFTAG